VTRPYDRADLLGIPVMVLVKSVVKSALVAGGACRLAQRCGGPRVALLRYHSIQGDPHLCVDSIGGGIIHPAALFRRQMELLARDFHFVTLDDVTRWLHDGQPMPRRSVAVTFDDGYHDNAAIAAPILDGLGIRACFYVTVDSIEGGSEPWFIRLRRAFASTRKSTWVDFEDGRTYNLEHPHGHHQAFLAACAACAIRAGQAQKTTVQAIEERLAVSPHQGSSPLMMTWLQVRRLREQGHLIGSHTLTHPNLARVPEANLRLEIRGSKERLEQKLGSPVVHFSYPNPILSPHWNSLTLEYCRISGYQTAVTSTEGPVNAKSNPLALRRVAVPFDLHQFRWVLERTLAFSR
jgi:peptidoglycan/xylan/chitin deacetylase (PgdA/CDA1 family)